jgi:predicted RNase H-like HicB family nuclease
MSAEARTIWIVGYRAEDGAWSAHSPQVRGVFGYGGSFADAVSDWREAAALYREMRGALVFIDDVSVVPDADAIEVVTIIA